MGTITALALLYRGFDVHLVSALLPEKMTILNGRKEHMASQIAGGMFFPYFYDRGGALDNDRMIKDSWNIISTLEAGGKYGT